MGAAAGAFAAAATTPLDVIKTNMMCTAASRPTMMSSARAVMAQGGPVHFFRCEGDSDTVFVCALFADTFILSIYPNVRKSVPLLPGLNPSILVPSSCWGAMCRGVGPRALSNGINSAVFFCFFEALRGSFKKRKALVSPANQVQCLQEQAGWGAG